MPYPEDQTEFVPVELDNGVIVKVQISKSQTSGRENVSVNKIPLAFKQITQTLEGVAETLKATLNKVKADKATVKFGVELGVESGSLAAMIVKGTGKGNLEITLEWDK